MNTAETNREIDKLLFDEIVRDVQNCKASFHTMRSELMVNYDRDTVLKATSSLWSDIMGLESKADRFSERLRRRKKK